MSSLALGLLLLAALGSVASAKPKVAILGIEVIGSLDPEQVKIAKQLTLGLRERATAGNGPFELAPNSDKELVDEKLMNNCGTEALVCMAPIGVAMHADYLMYGKIEKVDKGFHVTIKLIRVATKMPMPTFSEIISVSDLKNDPKGVAKRAYTLMTATDEGTVTVRVTNSDRATVYIDDKPVGTTSGGSLTISVSEGKHRLAIVAEDKSWQRYEQELSINAGDQRHLPIELTRVGQTPKVVPPEGGGTSGVRYETGGGGGGTRSGGGWKTIGTVTAVLGVVSVAAFGASWWTLSRNGNVPEQEADAGRFSYSCVSTDDSFKCKYGAFLKTTTYVAGIGAVALAGVTVFAFLKSSGGKERAVTSGRSAKARRELTVTPVISAESAGATLRFAW